MFNTIGVLNSDEVIQYIIFVSLNKKLKQKATINLLKSNIHNTYIEIYPEQS